jgi:exonuclease SbcC
MRPVLLEMTGFASFREPTVVDFSDADFFTLVGPTGAGRSTVIDVIFCLCGRRGGNTRPQWSTRWPQPHPARPSN